MTLSPWLVLVTIAALLFYFTTGTNAVRTRIRTGVKAPAMHGHPDVERALRVQGNTLEWIVIFLPALWLCGAYFDTRIVAGLGVVWILGRVLYMTGYMKDAAKRGPGFLIQALTTLILLIGAITGAVLTLLHMPIPHL
jgi:uncharacterized membrane protein YecN with MAPEG domain